MDLQALAVPLHDLVVADDALVGEATNAFEISRSWSSGCFRFARQASEAAVVVGDEAGQDAIGRILGAISQKAEYLIMLLTDRTKIWC
ncbi:MAG TPA: hypothetical protein VGR97_12735 [Candidatus Acidoferrales bacterium]|nr:hypothetical protein [Candidatus Acidoferrales bacterium]